MISDSGLLFWAILYTQCWLLLSIAALLHGQLKTHEMLSLLITT